MSRARPSPPEASGGAPIPLRRELLVSFAVLFGVAMILAVLAIAVLFPTLSTARDATLLLAALVAADLAVLFGFGSYVLRNKLVRPVERLVYDVRRMSEGGSHRVAGMPNAELQAIRESVNALADRLQRDQELLAENVASLERTNAELVEARDQVVRAARLASVGTLSAGIAHEIGNPLAAILGYAEVARSRALRDGGDPGLPEAIREEAWRIDRIVRGLLDYSRPRETGAGQVSPKDVLEGVRELLINQGRLDGVTHEWRFAEPLPRILARPSHLEQVMVNLLLNALDALAGLRTPRIEVDVSRRIGGGSVALVARRRDDPQGVDYRHRRRLAGVTGARGLTELPAQEVVVIRVADNGPGVPGDDVDRIFDPFFTTKPPGRGTGLGLAICARLVDDMGGRIEVENARSGGAVFSIHLPGLPVPEPVGAPAERMASALATSEVSP